MAPLSALTSAYFGSIIMGMKKVILISGGSSGLGYEMAKILSAGNIVVISSNNKKGFV
jgi:NAD(P)-dependent dehydrogenase (short-subunit alcohol dehydrogenase family)